jgi:periplasmic divalent cation tolerance protein
VTEFCVVYITVGSLEQAEQLAQALVKENLAACVNRVGPIHSTYRWQGEICQDNEYLLIAKTRQTHVQALSSRVQELHSYDVPEIIALPIVSGLPAYLDWIQGQTEEPNQNN